MLGAFALVQLRSSDPMVDLRLFRDPRFAGASAGVMALFFALTAATFLLTQVYQFVLGLSPLQAGLRALPPALTVAVVSPLGARLAQKTGPRAPIATGLALATGGRSTRPRPCRSRGAQWAHSRRVGAQRQPRGCRRFGAR